MANPFRILLREYPSDSRTGDSSTVALILALGSALAEASPTENVYSNVWRESLYRLRNVAGGDTPAIRRLEELFGDKVNTR
jgi:hypothetical protein